MLKASFKLLSHLWVRVGIGYEMTWVRDGKIRVGMGIRLDWKVHPHYTKLIQHSYTLPSFHLWTSLSELKFYVCMYVKLEIRLIS